MSHIFRHCESFSQTVLDCILSWYISIMTTWYQDDIQVITVLPESCGVCGSQLYLRVSLITGKQDEGYIVTVVMNSFYCLF